MPHEKVLFWLCQRNGSQVESNLWKNKKKREFSYFIPRCLSLLFEFFPLSFLWSYFLTFTRWFFHRSPLCLPRSCPHSSLALGLIILCRVFSAVCAAASCTVPLRLDVFLDMLLAAFLKTFYFLVCHLARPGPCVYECHRKQAVGRTSAPVATRVRVRLHEWNEQIKGNKL